MQRYRCYKTLINTNIKLVLRTPFFDEKPGKLLYYGLLQYAQQFI